MASGMAKGGDAFGYEFSRLTGKKTRLWPGILLVFAALVIASASFAILLGATSIAPTVAITRNLIVINLCVIAILVILIGLEFARVLSARRQKKAASRLHVRIIALFSFVSAVPAIVVAIVASITLDRGLDRWFEDRTRAIVESSVQVAQAYVDENARNLQGVTISLAFALDQAKPLYNLDRRGFGNFLTQQAQVRGLSKAVLVRPDGTPIFSADLPDAARIPDPPVDALETAAGGQAVIIPPGQSNLVGAILAMQQLNGLFLYTVATVNPEVMGSLQMMEANTDEYRGLQANRATTQIAFAVLYIGLTLIVLLAAVWTGIAVADRLVRPIRQLVSAAEGVANGDLSIRVPVKSSDGDLGQFASTFNGMVQRIGTQQRDLIDANTQIDDRRRFTEAVLSGVTAGVIGVGADHRITLVNKSALQLFPAALQAVGMRFEEALPEFKSVFSEAINGSRQSVTDIVHFHRNGQERTYSVQITADDNTRGGRAHVVTVDDITQLVDAQRSSAWADVARRIAHEIKNPLTPIQLSAERLRRRYGKLVESDPEVFDRCIDTIVRQVGDIGRMVDEFSSFARMPKPNLAPRDLRQIAREAMFLVEMARSDITLSHDLGEEPVIGAFDERMLGQAIGNLVKNASEAIDGREDASEPGAILVRVSRHGQRGRLDVIDNGKGLPVKDRNRLLEPYVTTREKGTGLGLAIVKKIIEEHGGELELADAPADFHGGKGAMVTTWFDLVPQESKPVEQTIEGGSDATPTKGGKA